MKLKNILFLKFLLFLTFISCSKDEDFTDNSEQSNELITNPSENEELEVENFVYNGLKEIYLYKDDVPELANNFFSSSIDKEEFLAESSSPEALFKGLTASFDRFSFITDDYKSLEERFQGLSGATGIKFGVGQISGTNNVFGIIRYVLPGTSAARAGLKRGDIFTEINGQKLTSANFESLIQKQNFTINLGYVNNNQIFITDKEVVLTDDTYTENPIYISKTFDISGKKIGYIMYNSFIGNFDEELNSAFGEFKANGVTNLILDLRYNGGGSVASAQNLATMVTGQFNGEVFMKEQWNSRYQEQLETQNPEALINRFNAKLNTGASINSLNLSEVYVLTSASSASASELIINGLDPYINVIQIGDKTVGKFQASVTLYNSDDFGKDGASENHTYAMQPLVFKSINADGNSDYLNGLEPDISYIENLNNFGVLGEEDEPLLEIALNDILGRSKNNKSAIYNLKYDQLGESEMHHIEYQRMYLDQLPEINN